MTRIEGRRKPSPVSVLRAELDLVYERMKQAFAEGPSSLAKLNQEVERVKALDDQLVKTVGESAFPGWRS